MKHKAWIAAAACGLTMLVGTGTLSWAGQPDARDHLGAGHAVATKGQTTFEPNSNVHSTLRFGPERIVVASGDQVRWVDRDADPDPHSITIVRRSELPTTIGEVFAGDCESCEHAQEGHFGGGGLVRKVEDDADGEVGLDEPGDSLWLDPDSKVTSVVSASAGTRLYYLCFIHPWMIGKIKVA